MEITLKPGLTTLTTLTTLEHYADFTHFSPIPTFTLSPLNLRCQNLSILVDRLSYFDWSIGAPDTYAPQQHPLFRQISLASLATIQPINESAFCTLSFADQACTLPPSSHSLGHEVPSRDSS